MSEFAGFEFRNGLPVKIESFASSEEKKNWKIVRRDNYQTVEGMIIAAIVDTGEVTILVKVAGANQPETRTTSFGPDGIRIVPR